MVATGNTMQIFMSMLRRIYEKLKLNKLVALLIENVVIFYQKIQLKYQIELKHNCRCVNNITGHRNE